MVVGAVATGALFKGAWDFLNDWELAIINGEEVSSASGIILEVEAFFTGPFIMIPLRSPKAVLAALIAAEREAPKS